ncbi:oligosaccharide flippase family protein [Myroides odoratimimus]|uniref:lipopolysaccharide biosynthesis protein n=1 Tax=Myroides odoratimimus TaxID=76832 RepID=UPI00103D0564|nr:polysaccharide biosynthesis C-terminal domain-containing protein [Myroides odoratimimus]MCA4791800.1 oligosaccharide flippase family protein [Myroides odoratimimus]MCA4805655.1 oligosaccharide flippase family protein [Myroides odoratimimus]MCA4819061.1 oligosaccharide flippase family protein [Myroides odoratimimus]MDM1059168.1 oligosaccharide flippase family protein [Myroides odoratimimus]MDM1091744.1 oligosaccharide flippase family protein [Myroides odoratimimus]
MQDKISTKQAFLFTLINYIGVLIGVVSTVLIYPQDKELLGIIRFVDACAQIIFPIIVLGSTHALINFYPKLSERLQGKLFSYSMLSMIKLTIGVGIVLLLGSYVYDGAEMRYVVMGFVLAISMAYIELFRRQATNLQRLSFPTFFEKIIPKIALPTVFLIVVYGSFSIDNAVWYYIVSYYVIAIVIGTYIYRHFKFNWHWKYDDLFTHVGKKEYYAYSLFAFAGSFGSFFAFRVDSLMIPYFISYEANGTYNIGVTLASTLAIPATGVFALYAPIISDLIKRAELRTLNMKYKEVARNLFFIGMLLFSCVVVGIEPLFQLLPTYDKLAPSLPIIYLLGINVVINMSTGFNTEIISYSKYYRFNLVSILSLMVLNVVLNYVLLAYTDLGIFGVGLASLLSLTLFNIVKTYYIYQKMKLWPFDINFFKLMLFMLAFVVIIFLIPNNSHPLLVLVLKVGLVIILNFIVLLKTNWVIGVKSMLDKLFRKLGL